MVVASGHVLPPWWDSGATASVKALENLGTRPGQLWATELGGRTGLLSFFLYLGAQGQRGGSLQNVGIATERHPIPKARRGGTRRKTSLEKSVGHGTQP